MTDEECRRHDIQLATAVGPWIELVSAIKARRAGISPAVISINAAPSALDLLCSENPTVLRPWLLNHGPSDLALVVLLAASRSIGPHRVKTGHSLDTRLGRNSDQSLDRLFQTR